MEASIDSPPMHGAWLRRVGDVFAGRGFWWRIAAVALVIGLPALTMGLLVDDYLHRLIHLRTYPFENAVPQPWHMFSLLTGSPEDLKPLFEYGLYPWWTSLTIRVSFWRPLTIATHMLDYAAWPNSILLMHAQSLLWFVAMCAAVAILYRRFESPLWVAGLAALLYALDEAHAIPVGWLANRNALVSTLFGVVCLILHDAWRRDRKPVAAIGALVAFVAALLAKESGIAITAYLFAYALFLDRGRLVSRLLTLAPYTVIVLIWGALYSAQGFGAEGSPLYIDPLAEPLRFTVAFFERAPALLLGQFVNFPTEFLQAVPLPARLGFAAIALAIIAVILWIIRPVLATPTGRFWALGMAISVTPSCTVGAMNRELGFVALGGMPLIAQYIAHVYASKQVAPRAQCGLAAGFVALHLVLAPIMFVGTLAGFSYLGHYWDAAMDRAPFPENIDEKTVVIVDSPSYFLTVPLPIRRSLHGEPVPAHMYTLSPNSMALVPITMRREDEHTLVVTPEGGFPEIVFRSVHEPFRVGDRITLPGIRVEILEADAKGVAMSVAYRFDVPLEDESLFFVQMSGLDYEEFTPPAIGESVVLNP